MSKMEEVRQLVAADDRKDFEFAERDASLYETLTGLIEPITANFPVVTP